MRDSTSPLVRHKFVHTATVVVLVVVIYGIAFTTPMLKHISERVDSVQKLLVERGPFVEEIDDAVSTPQQNDDYVEPIWSCSDTNRHTKLVFSHIFKTAGRFTLL